MTPFHSLTFGELLLDGSLPWKWKSVGFPYLKITKCSFHVFDRYEIHIQAFGDVFMGKSSFPDPHLHKIILNICNHIFTKINETNKTNRYPDFREFSICWCPYSQNNMFPGCSQIFLVFLEAFLYTKINTGFQGFGNPEIMKLSSFDV